MAAVLLRRSVAAATLATIATALVPTAVSMAAPSAFAASSITTDPAPDSSNVVAANRPKVVATFNDTPASGSIKLTENGGSSTNLCGTPVIDAAKHTVTCQPDSDLGDGKKYDAVGTATDSAGHTAKTSTLTFTADYPTLDEANSVPIPNGALTGGGEDITAAFDEPITGNDKSTFASDAAFKLFEINADGSRGVQLGGAISFGGNVVQGSDNTVTFDPAANLSNGRYEAVLLVNGVGSDGKANPKAIGRADYSVFINNTAPFNLSVPVPKYNGVPYANTANNSAFPLSGFAAPGLTVTVDVFRPGDPTGFTDNTATVVVPTCASAPACPWTATIDISDYDDANDVDWTASIQDANGQPSSNAPTSQASAQSPPATFNIDTSAPPQVKTNPAPAISSDSKTVTVNATDTATDVVSYLVTITDPQGNKVNPTFPAQGTNLPATPIDVTTLDDGQLTITIQAVDNHGNVSPTNGPPQGDQPYHVTKNVGLLPNLGTSLLTSNGDDTTFVDAQQQSVMSPDKITVGFTQTIKQSYTDNTTAPPTTHNSSMCVATQNGNCLASNAATVNSDNRSLSMKLTNPLADGLYEVRATTYSAGNCPDKTPVNANGYKCEQFSGLVMDPNTGTPFQFRVDSSKPTIEITQWTHPVTAQNQKSVSISGTVDKNVDTVQLLITSDGSSSQRLLFSASITQPSDPSATQATWSSGPRDLSTLPDGTLTIKATAKKSNGLSGSDTVHARMQAHLSVLTEVTDRHKVTFGHVIHISGRLTDETGAAITTATISVRPKFASGKFGKAAADVTDSNGNYSVTFKPRHNATYYATYEGSPEHDGVKTHTARTLVRWKVTIGSPNPGSHQSSPVTIRGKVGPNHKRALVTIYRHTAGGNTVVGKARLDKRSRFSTKVVLPAGTNKVFAKVKKTSSNLAGKSRVLRFRVG
jgi:methionine-rich copper-binding protein CopC